MSAFLAVWWAVAASATSAVVDVKGLPTPLSCAGGEPFWTLAVHDASRVIYKDDLGERQFRIVRVDNAAQRPTTWRVTFASDAGHALIFDEQPSCSDSDGDEPWAFGVILESKEGLLRGCCREAR